MTQYMRPASDINSGWTCSTGTARYALIDEVSASDSDYIYNDSDGAYQECKFAMPTQTPNAGIAILRFRAKKNNSNLATITPSVWLGSSAIKTGSKVYLTTSYAEYSLELSSAEVESITDWSDVRVRFLSNVYGNTIYVSWAVFEVPDGSSNMGLEMGCSF